jgi:hypothetical protein
MTYQIRTHREWRYRHPKKGISVLPPGLHNVPADLPEAVAELAVLQGMAQKLAPPASPVREFVSRLPDEGSSRVNERATELVKEIAKPRKRGRPRKGPAPENKALHVAEDK